MKTEVKSIIKQAYTDLERICESSSDASRLLREATEAALEGEKSYRRGQGRSNRGALTVAQYFVVKWTLFPVPCPKSWLDTDVRDEARLGSTLNALLRRDKGKEIGQWVYRHHSDVASVDYATDLVS